jgi:hypothetical protein
VVDTLPSRPGGPLCTFGIDVIPIELPSPGVDIHLGRAEPALALPGVTGNPKDKDTEESKVDVEEILGSTNLLPFWQAKR